MGAIDPGGRYQLINRIGGGNYAEAYTAVDTQAKELVVIKCLALTGLTEAKRTHLLRYLGREVVNHGPLDHPNIIKLKQVFLTTLPQQPHQHPQPHFCMVLELASAGSLLQHYDTYSRVFGSGFPPNRARWFLQQLVVALEYLHSMNMSHRDVKPDNILLQADSRYPMPILKLADFGVSSRMREPTDRLTSLVGTRSNYAPEMLLKEQRLFLTQELQRLAQLDEQLHSQPPAESHELQQIQQQQLQQIEQAMKSTRGRLAEIAALENADKFYAYDGTMIDMWSCGVVLYYMLTGEPVFGLAAYHPPGQQAVYRPVSFAEHIAQIQRGPRLDHPAFDVPDGARIRRLLQWLLQFNPHERATIEQLRNSPCPGCQWFREGMDQNPFAQQHGQLGPLHDVGAGGTPHPQLEEIVQAAQAVLGGGQPGQQPQAMAMG